MAHPSRTVRRRRESNAAGAADESRSPDVQQGLGLDTDSWLRAYRQSVRTHPSVESALGYFKRIFDEAPASYIITNLEMVVTDANHAAQHMLHRPLLTLRDRSLFIMVSKEDRAALRTMAAEVIQEHKGITRPLRIQPFRDEPLEVIVSACVTRDAKGDPECMYWIFLHPVVSRDEDLL